ncbi:class I SAM-dependent methyltransferase [Burkholderia gladioli]|uniref:class I SAM-dependent methyltransferase n=1 Tax=Burkholderia gladioli TaxID=28095 RepID=UPI0009B8ABA9|nr:class I SAM-dependent methyltransferase [Burkholderia gladioli]AYQ89519.1 class I SAM-dependent methyltransferase [Burkholderia gladioli]
MGRDFPELAAKHIAGARLYANRFDLISDLRLAPDSHIAEVGVALGTFSKFMIEKFKPKQFCAFDLFQIHIADTLWGRPTREVLRGMTHRQFYEAEMQNSTSPVITHEGLSSETLPRYPDEYFDMIYIDAAHTFDEVKLDAEISAAKIKKDGVLIFNDYIMHDPFIHADYGIVPVVNEMVVNHGWRVIGFGLQKHMFCDIAIQRG